MLELYGDKFESRFLLGTALYPSPAIMADAVRASGAGIVTVSLRRESSRGKNSGQFWTLVQSLGVRTLPNTAGCHSVKEAVTTAHMARELFGTRWIKLEVIGNHDTLQPDVFGLVEAARILAADGFEVFPYTTDDLVVAGRLLDAGCRVLMPWCAPIRFGARPDESRCIAQPARTFSRCAIDRRCRARQTLARSRRDGAGLRRGAAQHGGCKGRRSRSDGFRLCPSHRCGARRVSRWPA